MNYNKKIPAYTLSEILIVLAITTIVIGIAFSALTLVTKQYNAMRDAYGYRTTVLQFKQQLLLDFDTAKDIHWEATEEILFIQGATQNISYEWNTDFIVRDTDTLNVGIEEALFLNNGKEVENGYIDGLALDCVTKGKRTRLFVSRKTDAQYSLEALWE